MISDERRHLLVSNYSLQSATFRASLASSLSYSLSREPVKYSSECLLVKRSEKQFLMTLSCIDEQRSKGFWVDISANHATYKLVTKYEIYIKILFTRSICSFSFTLSSSAAIYQVNELKSSAVSPSLVDLKNIALVSLRGTNLFEPRPLNKILVPVRVFFKNFRRAPPSLLYESHAGCLMDIMDQLYYKMSGNT